MRPDIGKGWGLAEIVVLFATWALALVVIFALVNLVGFDLDADTEFFAFVVIVATFVLSWALTALWYRQRRV